MNSTTLRMSQPDMSKNFTSGFPKHHLSTEAPLNADIKGLSCWWVKVVEDEKSYTISVTSGDAYFYFHN